MMMGNVVNAIELYGHAAALARGVEDLDMRAMTTVSLQDMRTASTFAEAIDAYMQELYAGFDKVRWPVLAGNDARTLVGGAADASRMLRTACRESLERSRRDAREVSAVKGGLLPLAVRRMRVAQEALEIVAGERPVTGSTFAFMAEGRAQTLLEQTPILGEAVLIYQAVLGREAASGRKLSDLERACSGFAVLLPFVLRAVGKAAARGATSAAVITRRSVEVALEYKRVYTLLETAKRIPRAVQVATGLRSLSQEQFAEFRALLAQSVRAVSSLQPRQAARLNYFFSRMHDAARLAAWLRIAEKELGPGVPGFVALKNAKFSPAERRVMESFAKRTNSRVVGLPEVLPMDYPGRTRLDGVKHPDAIWRDGLVDFYIPEAERGSVTAIISNVGKKRSQCPTVIVALENAKVSASAIAERLPDFWANPRHIEVSRIVLFDGIHAFVHTRPERFAGPFMYGLWRPLAFEANHLIKTVKELEEESP